MKSVYFKDGDTLSIRFSDQPIAKERSIDWHTNVSYDANGNLVELVLLEAYTHHRHLFDACKQAHIYQVRRKAGTRPKGITSAENGKKGGRPRKVAK